MLWKGGGGLGGFIMQGEKFSFMQVQYLIPPHGCCIIVIKFLLVHAAAETSKQV